MFLKKNYYKHTYKKNSENEFEILVALNKYEDIYSDWDPTPFRRRDIESDFIDFIWDSAFDIPLYEKIRIVLLIKTDLRNTQKEEQVLKALGNYFKYMLAKAEREYFTEQKKSLCYLVIGILLAFIVYNDLFGKVEIWTKVFAEGVMIGTWVFFWEAFYNFFIECQTVRKEIKMIKRFIKARYAFENNN